MAQDSVSLRKDNVRHLMSAATQPGIRKLPSELVYHIIRLAASTDYKTAHSCAYVSKTVCEWTSADRWKTVIITSLSQLEDLNHILVVTDEDAENAHRDSGEGAAEAPGIISLPSTHPGHFIENIFIDTDRSHLSDPVEEDYGAFERVFETLFHVNYLALGPREVERFHGRIAKLSPSKFLCTSYGADTELWKTLLDAPCSTPHWTRCQCKESLSATGRESSSSSANSRLIHQKMCPSFVPSLSGFQRRLKSFHMIGIDESSKVTGLPIPFRNLESLRSGSTEAASLLYYLASESRDGRNATIWPASDEDRQHPFLFSSASNIEHLVSPDNLPWQRRFTEPYIRGLSPYNNMYGNISTSFFSETSQGVTSLRYDTRQFSLRPSEITALHLRRFFQELVATPSADSAPADSTTPSSNFTHVGPRHAAPLRGAGNYYHLNTGQSGIVSHLQPHFDRLGSRQFRTLELCWDPLTPLRQSDPSALAKATRQDTESGWPMERQDIWTNTSSQNNVARAPPPHQTCSSGPALSMKSFRETRPVPNKPTSRWKVNPKDTSVNSRAFRTDLSDSIRTTLGWTAYDQEQLGLTATSYRSPRSGQFELMPELTNVELGNAFHRMLAELVQKSGSGADQSQPASPAVHLAVQPPLGKLKLGQHYVPYSKQERLAWFLDNLDTSEA